MATRADIEIAVRGATQLVELEKLLRNAGKGVDALNNEFKKGAVPSIDNFNAAVARSNTILRSAAQGTKTQKDAIDVYVRSVAAAEKAEKSLQNAIEQRRKELNLTTETTNKAGGRGASRAISSAVIGGAFPLLFGQGGGAATGGAIGGIAGELALGPGGGFAGSLLGTLIGGKLEQANKVKELAADIGFSAEQTKNLAKAFQQAGADFDKFQQSVSRIQGLSLSIDDQGKAIQLASTLTEKYKGSIDKVTNAFSTALETGKVTQGTLNQLTNQGIPIQDALAKKYDVSRSAILQMAKDGKISVQDLIDTLVDLGNKGTGAVNKNKAAFDGFIEAAKNLGTALAPEFNFIIAQLTKVFNLAVAGLNAINAQLAAGRAGALNRNITSAKLAGAPFVGAPSESLDQVSRGIKQLTTQKNKAGIEQNLNAIKQYSDLLQTVGSRYQDVGNIGERARQLQGELLKLRGQNLEALKKVPTASSLLKSFAVPAQLPPSGDKTASDKAAKAAEREAARVADIVRDRAVETELLHLQSAYAEQILAADLNKDPILKSQLQTQEKVNAISLQYSKDINDEIAKGNSVAAQEAITKKALAEVNKVLFEGALSVSEIEIKRAENYQNMLLDLQYEVDLRSATTEQAREQLRIAYEMEKLRRGNEFTDPQLAEIKKRKQQIAAPKMGAEAVQERIGKLQDEITKLTDIGNVAITVADGIGTAFGQAFQGLVTGAMTAQQALASFFKSVGEMFISMATEIIAKQMVMFTLQTILKALGLFGGGGGGGFGAGGNAFNPAGIASAGTGGIPSLGASFGFATGGFVTGPTNAVIGEGGQPEYIIPASKMSAAMNRYSAGARGAAVIPAGDINTTTGTNTNNALAPSTINVNYTVERINSVDYVTVDQFQAGMRRAATEGAQRGQQLTLQRLQQSPTTRRKVGI